MGRAALLLALLFLAVLPAAHLSRVPKSLALSFRERITRPAAAVLATGLSFSFAPKTAEAAAPGAFEMDAQVYLRNLLQIQKKQADTVRIVFRSPRRIDEKFASDVLECVIALLPGFDREELSETVRKKASLFREFAPIVSESLADQYYFDLTLFCAYEQAKRILPSSQDRVEFRDKLGAMVLETVLRHPGGRSVPIPSPAQTLPLPQEQIAAGIDAILKVFQTTGQIDGFVFDAADFADAEFAAKSFQAALPVSATIQLKEPATVLSFIEGVKLNTFFHPEFIGSSLVAYLQRCGLGGRFEDYLLDNYYRESNFDVQAQDVIVELQVRGDTEFSLR